MGKKKELKSKNVITRISFELGNQEHQLENKLKQMSLKIRSSDVLKYLEDVVDSKLTHIDFGDIMSLYPDEPDFPYKVLQLIRIKAENLLEFAVKAIKIDFSPPKIPDTWHLDIGYLTTLRMLVITRFHLELDELTMMCCALPCLKYLSVKINVDLDYFDSERNLPKLFRSCFGQLQFFHFTAVGADADIFQQTLTKFCIEHLLCLQGVGDEDFPVDMTSLCKNLSKTSCIKQLMLDMETFEKAECKFDKFPNINSLFIKWSDSYAYRPIEQTKLHLLRNFKNVNCLKIVNLKSLRYLKFLIDAYKKKLVRFMIASDLESKKKILDLKLVQKLLPNLHTLKLFNTKISPEDCCSLREFWKLKEMIISFVLDESEACLSDLLAPPALELLCLINLKTSRKELQKAVDKIKRREVCGNIKHFHIYVIGGRGEKMKKIIQEKGDELVQELRKMKPGIKSAFYAESRCENRKKQ